VYVRIIGGENKPDDGFDVQNVWIRRDDVDVDADADAKEEDQEQEDPIRSDPTRPLNRN